MDTNQKGRYVNAFSRGLHRFVTAEVFDPIKASLIEEGGRGEKKVGLGIDVPVMPNNEGCRVRMRFVLVDTAQDIMAGQAFVDDTVGKWRLFDFSDDDGDFLGQMLEALDSLGDALL